MINSYRYGDALAIARIAELAGRKELADHYRAEAEQLRKRVQEPVVGSGREVLQSAAARESAHQPV